MDILKIVKKFMSRILRDKWFFVKTLVLLMLLWFVASLEYMTIVMLLLTFVWRKKIARWCIFSRRRWGRVVARHSWKVLMAVLMVQLWISLPRYRTGSDDRLQLYYLNERGERVSTPVSHWLFNALLPEEEIMNLGVWGARSGSGIVERLGIGGTMTNQFKSDNAEGKINNFYAPYRNLDKKGLSLVSATTSQAFNDLGIGDKTKAVYVLRPNAYNEEKAYPVVFFCHGYLGNWKLYQGLFAGMDDCLVVSCGTEGLSGIFTHDDISGLLNNIIPMLEREGYKINREAMHLIGLSNGGTACEVAQSRFPGRFKSITYVSTGISHTGKTKSTINLIGGGKDPSSSTMYPAYRALKKNGTNANILWYDDESHFVFVNKVSEIMSFIMHDVGMGRAETPSSWLNSVDEVLTYISLGNLLLVLYPLLLVGVLLFLSIYGLVCLLIAIVGCFIALAILNVIASQMPKGGKQIKVMRWIVRTRGCIPLMGRFFRWFLCIVRKSLSAWRRCIARYWTPILILWFASISMNCFKSISYNWTKWEGFEFHDEKDIGKCLGIKSFPMCHVISKDYSDYPDGGTYETATLDTDDYADFIKRLSEKVGKDSLWNESSWNEEEITYTPDSLHIPKGLVRLSVNFQKGKRTFTIYYY